MANTSRVPVAEMLLPQMTKWGAALAAALTLGITTLLGAQIPAAEFAARRDSLAARIDNGVVVAFGGRTLVQDFGPFFQLPAFHYLTNVDEPDAAFVMVVRRKRGAGTLFLSPINPRTAFYYGQRADSSTSQRLYGLPGRAFASLGATLDSLATSGLPFYTLADFEDADFARADSLTRGQAFIQAFSARHAGLVVRSAHPMLNELRARKTPAEIALLRRAAEISSEGHRAAMVTPNPFHEYELRAVLEFTFTKLGAERPAYGSIVGAGINGTQLHYMKDTGPAKAGDLVVMDAAAEYRGYAADITRTIPVSGTFTVEQRQIYQLVRDAQDVAERNSKPGMRAQLAQDSSAIVRAVGLAALGLIESVDATFDPPWQVNCSAQPAACKQSNLWMIHGISHGLGLAVHDPVQSSFGDGTYKVGDAFTIEPGIYISTRSLDVLPDTPKNRAFIAKVRSAVTRYENTGVRVEDDYVITEKGLERISLAPREIPEIEALMRTRARVQP
ncbi:MAG TPA: aminopeptidase P N-terminal domain-containing protein [Gemmatimonadaceae bacterium]|nr:aminopeptidase P N-terminal domain-containing protein [Gemmatimonadaceae bacterium]